MSINTEHARDIGKQVMEFAEALDNLHEDIKRIKKERDEARIDHEHIASRYEVTIEQVDRLVKERDEAHAAASRWNLLVEHHGMDLNEAEPEDFSPVATVPRVITPDELREGQVVAAKDAAGSWMVLRPKGSALVTDSGAMALTVGMARCIVLLADALTDPEPEPWEPDEPCVGIVTHFNGGARLDFPTEAWFDGGYWLRVDGRNWPDERDVALPSEVTVTRAKVVPDDE
ncbi:hypothetical protein [Nesterenkonia suensis]